MNEPEDSMAASGTKVPMSHPETFPDWDPDILATIVGTNPDIQKRILKSFIASATDSIAKMSEDGTRADWAAIAATAHRLKSAARTVGAVQLGAWCERLERICSSGQTGDGPSLLATIERSFAAARERMMPKAEPLPG